MGKKILAILMVLALAVSAMSVAAFADDDYTVPKTIKINQGSSRTLEKGRVIPLTYTITPRDTDMYDGVSWYSTDTKVAEVDQDGIVTAIDPGTADIYVRTDNGKENKITITVPGRVSGLDWGSEYSSSESSSSVAPSVASSSSSQAATATSTKRVKLARDTLVSEVRSAAGKTVKLEGYSSVSAASLQAAAAAGKSKVQIDTMNGSSVTGRILIDPAKAKDLTGNIKLGVYTTSSKTKTAQAGVNSQYKTKNKVIYCEQDSYGMQVTITAKVGSLDDSNLKVYTCDKDGKNVKSLKVSNLKLDSKGYVKFTTDTGGYLIISEGTLK